MPYASALGVTVAVGCSLLALNALIFAAVYYQRDKTVKLLQKNGGRSSANDSSKQVSDSEEGVRSSFRNNGTVQEDKKSREIAQMETLCHSHGTTICGLHHSHDKHECHEHQHLHQLAMSEVINSPQVRNELFSSQRCRCSRRRITGGVKQERAEVKEEHKKRWRTRLGNTFFLPSRASSSICRGGLMLFDARTLP